MKKPDIKEIDFSIYDVKDNVKYEYQTGKGLSKEVVLEISEQKNEPSWMRDFRLKALEIYQKCLCPHGVLI